MSSGSIIFFPHEIVLCHNCSNRRHGPTLRCPSLRRGEVYISEWNRSGSWEGFGLAAGARSGWKPLEVASQAQSQKTSQWLHARSQD